MPIASVRQVVLFGNVQISTQALHTLAGADVPLVFLSSYGRFIASVLPAPPKNVSLRAAQYQIFCRPRQLPVAGAGGCRRQDRQPANAADALVAVAAARTDNPGR